MRGMRQGIDAGNSWFWAAVICGGLGLFEATESVVVMRAEGMHHAWPQLFVATVLSWAPWALAAPVVLRLARQYPLFHRSSVGGWLHHVGLWLAIVVVAAAWNAGLGVWLDPYAPDYPAKAFPEMFRMKLYNQVLSSAILYGGILLVGWMLESQERLARQQMEAAQLSEQLAKAQLSALRQQVEPHFLFNTMNTIAGLVREGKNDAAVNMIAGLSELLRRTLKTTERQQVALGEELEVVQKYLEIEKARFAERLQVRVEVPEELREARVPSLILQPLVENAVKHGIAARVEGGSIEIAASRVNGTLLVRVKNDGPGFPASWETKGGIGLENVRERLASLYGSAGELRVGNENGAVVTVVVPWRDFTTEDTEEE
jgi:two-component system LytT family sensor kinase